MTRERSYHALSWHFGQYLDQSVHVHSCIDHDNCNHVLIGEGRECDNKKANHREATLTVKGPKYAPAAQGTSSQEGKDA